MKNFNTENFLQHVDIEKSQWRKERLQGLHDSDTLKKLTPETFQQIYEVTKVKKLPPILDK